MITKFRTETGIYQINRNQSASPVRTQKVAISKSNGQPYEIVREDGDSIYIRAYDKNYRGDFVTAVQCKSDKKNFTYRMFEDAYKPLLRRN